MTAQHPAAPEGECPDAGDGSEVEALGTWMEHYLGNYTLPANYAAPLYGQTHREVAKYVGPVIAEDLLASDWLAAREAAARAEERERNAQAIEADANTPPKGSLNHRAYAGHFAALVRSRS